MFELARKQNLYCTFVNKLDWHQSLFCCFIFWGGIAKAENIRDQVTVLIPFLVRIYFFFLITKEWKTQDLFFSSGERRSVFW